MILHATFSLSAIGRPPEASDLCASETDLMACVHAVAMGLRPSASLVVECRVADTPTVVEVVVLPADKAPRLDGLALIRAALDLARANSRRVGQLTVRVSVKSREGWWRELAQAVAAWWRKVSAQ